MKDNYKTMMAEIPQESLWSHKSKVSLAVVGGDTQVLRPNACCDPANAHHQDTVRVKASTHWQGVHILREQRLMGERVTDASIVQNLKNGDEKSEKGLLCC